MHVATLLNVPPIVCFLDELKGRIRKAHHSFKDEHKEKKESSFLSNFSQGQYHGNQTYQKQTLI